MKHLCWFSSVLIVSEILISLGRLWRHWRLGSMFWIKPTLAGSPFTSDTWRLYHKISKKRSYKCGFFKRLNTSPLDHGHEQNNVGKGSGGVVELAENPAASRIWMVSGPQQARLLKEFEDQFMDGENVNIAWTGMTMQEVFRKQVKSLTEAISEMGNPFIEYSSELLAFDTWNCANKDVVSKVRTIEALGISQFQKHVKDVISDRSTSIHKPIKRNYVAIWKRLKSKPNTSAKQHRSSKNKDYNLSASSTLQLSQYRDGDSTEFFAHENHPWSSSLLVYGALLLPTKKPDLVEILTTDQPDPPSYYHAKVFYDAAIVHALPANQTTL